MKALFTEVISTSPADSATIEECGSNRIELVSALEIGGVTPGYGLLRRSLEAASIPTNVIIRHQNNGFVYSPAEKEVMMDEVVSCRDLFHPAGVVIGSLICHQSDGKVELLPDMEFVRQVIKEVGGKMTVTFHKASDQITDYRRGVEDILKAGVDQILTQGGTGNVLHETNKGNIKGLGAEVRGKNILCGGGVNLENKREIVSEWGVERLHVGTCVREGRYGPVSKEKVLQFQRLV